MSASVRAGVAGAVVVSPHLDDAVFGCGRWLATHAGSRVVTVFAGVPRDAAQSTDWDRQCGFDDAASAVRARRQEDREALGRVGAKASWMDHADSQYGETPTRDALAASLRERLDELAPSLVLLPLGLFHSDHRLVHDATLAALQGLPQIRPLAYEDALYRRLPGELQRRLAALLENGIVATPEPLPPEDAAAAAAKRHAIEAYPSQLHAFGPGGVNDLAEPERFWRIDLRGAASVQAAAAPASPGRGGDGA